MSSQDTLSLLCQSLKQAQKNPESKPVFWLGAGCSRYDGIPANDQLLELTVPDSAGLKWGSRQYHFDRFCRKQCAGSRADRLSAALLRQGAQARFAVSRAGPAGAARCDQSHLHLQHRFAPRGGIRFGWHAGGTGLSRHRRCAPQTRGGCGPGGATDGLSDSHPQAAWQP